MHLFLFAFLFSGQAIDSASLTGRVEDSTAARIPGVRVSAILIDRDQSFLAITDSEGRFRFPPLPIGSYRIRAQQDGFAADERGITLRLGQAADLTITLSVGPLAQTVNVVDEVRIIEAGRTQIAEPILTAEVDTLPLNGRNYLDLSLLAPGVSRTNTGSNERFAETSGIPGTGISVAGQRNLSNGFIVDGLSANDDAADLAGAFFSQEVIHEFQIVTGGAIPEFGRASSGIVNVATRSGTNEWHGKVYGFFRNHRFDAAHIFSSVHPQTGKRIRTPLTQAQYGVSAGGPLRPGRAFLFTNVERQDMNRSGFITISPANRDTISSVLSQTGYRSALLATGEYPTGDDRTNVFAKADYQRTDHHRLAFRYSFYEIDNPNARNVGGLSAASRATLLKNRDQTLALNSVAGSGAGSTLETRVQFTRSRLAAPGNDVTGPAVNISGVANFGASTTSPTRRDSDLIQAVNNYSINSGNHVFKAGLDWIYNRVGIDFPGSSYGVYSFASMGDFVAGRYNTFTQAFGREDWFQTNPNLGWFVQDEWKPWRNFTVVLGLRHDVQWLAAGIGTRGRNLAPRAGIAYAAPDGKTVVRAGFGRYYDRIPLRAVANALRGAGVEYKTVTLQRTQAGAPEFPSRLGSLPGEVLFNLATIDKRIKTPYSLQADVQVEREISARTALSVAYLHTRGLHIIMQRNLNAPSVSPAQDPVNLGRPDPRFANITEYSGQGDSYYDGLTVSLKHAAPGGRMLRVSYTLSKAIDNTGNAFFSSPQDNFNIRNDRGLSDNDQRHRLSVSGQLSLLGFDWSGILAYGSAYPFNVLTGGQTVQATPARKAGEGRNTGRGFSSSSVDLRLARRVALSEGVEAEFIAESFNTLNRTNRQFLNNTFGNGAEPLPSFGRATNAGDPRQIQLGARVSF